MKILELKIEDKGKQYQATGEIRQAKQGELILFELCLIIWNTELGEDSDCKYIIMEEVK